MNLPQAQTSDIVVQDLGTELLVYDLKTHQAYTLNETARGVFNFCDGKHSFVDLYKKHQFTDDLIHLALDQLQRHNLLEADYTSPFTGINRREIIRKVGLASMIALPVISGLIAPPAAHALSCVNPGGHPPNTNVSGFPTQQSCANCLAAGAGACCSGNAVLASPCSVIGNSFGCTVTCQ